MGEIADSTSPAFNPHSQPITIYYRDGTNLTLALSDFNTANHAGLVYCSIFAAQIGACVVLLSIVGLLTSQEKRRTLLFACNILALVTVIFRSALSMDYYLGPFYDAYRFMSGDMSDIPSGARYSQIAATTGSLLLKSVVQFSLILQLRVVYASSPKLNLIMTLGTSIVALTEIALFFKVTVESAMKIMEPGVGVYYGDWTYPAAKAVFAFSICLFCFIFVLKLGYAIRRRRILGLRAFGPLQIIFTVGCQTMIIPAAFSLADNVVEIDGLSSLTPTLVAIFLPLSSMWAAAQVEAPSPVTATGLKSFGNSSGSKNSQKDLERGARKHKTVAYPRTGWNPDRHPLEVSQQASSVKIESIHEIEECSNTTSSATRDSLHPE